MRIAFASGDWGSDDGGAPIPGGSGWARVHMPADALTDAGHRVGIGGYGGLAVSREHYLVPLLPDRRTPAILNPDIIVLQRWMNEHAAAETRRARAAGQLVIHDVDDWFWGLDPANRAHATTSARHNREHNRGHYRAAVSAADAVTCSTPFLAKRIRERFGVQTILLRNTVDTRAYLPNPVRARDDDLTIGWVGALAWRSGDLETLAPFLDGWLAANKSTFTHRGRFPTDTDGDRAHDRLRVDPARTDQGMPACPPWSYPDLLRGIDIGLVPLADVPFNRAKSWIKGLEYAAAGIPFVAARLPEYEALAAHGAGLLASTPQEWIGHLDTLRDPDQRARVRAAGMHAADRLDLRERWIDWQETYEGLLASR